MPLDIYKWWVDEILECVGMNASRVIARKNKKEWKNKDNKKRLM